MKEWYMWGWQRYSNLLQQEMLHLIHVVSIYLLFTG